MYWIFSNRAWICKLLRRPGIESKKSIRKPLSSLAESPPWNRFLGSFKDLQIWAQHCEKRCALLRVSLRRLFRCAKFSYKDSQSAQSFTILYRLSQQTEFHYTDSYSTQSFTIQTLTMHRVSLYRLSQYTEFHFSDSYSTQSFTAQAHKMGKVSARECSN